MKKIFKLFTGEKKGPSIVEWIILIPFVLAVIISIVKAIEMLC